MYVADARFEHSLRLNTTVRYARVMVMAVAILQSSQKGRYTIVELIKFQNGFYLIAIACSRLVEPVVTRQADIIPEWKK